MIVSDTLPVIGDHPHALCKLVVLCENGTAVTIATQVLGRKKRCRTDRPHGTRLHLFTGAERISGADRLCIVLDHIQPMTTGNVKDLLHRGRLAVEMNRHDRLRTGRDGLFHRYRIDAEGTGIHFHEDRLQFQKGYDFRRGDVREGWRDDLITWLKPKGHHGDLQGVRPVGTRNHMPGTGIGSEMITKVLHRLPPDEYGAVEHPMNGGIHFVLDMAILLFKVNHLYRTHIHFYLKLQI